jgi:hypothetical protein
MTERALDQKYTDIQIVQSSIVESLNIPESSDLLEFKTAREHKTKPPLQQKQKQLVLGSLQLNKDKSGPRYSHYGDPELIKLVYSDSLRGLAPEQIPKRIEELQNPAMQSVHRLTNRFRKITRNPAIYDPLARDFLAELRSLSPLYKKLNVDELIFLMRRKSIDELKNFLDSPSEYLPNKNKRIKERQIGPRQRELVTALAERDEDGKPTYDYSGDVKLLKRVWFSSLVKYEGMGIPSRVIQKYRGMSAESISNLIQRFKKGDKNVKRLFKEIRTQDPFYGDVSDEEIILLLTRKRQEPAQISTVKEKKKRNKVITDLNNKPNIERGSNSLIQIKLVQGLLQRNRITDLEYSHLGDARLLGRIQKTKEEARKSLGRFIKRLKQQNPSALELLDEIRREIPYYSEFSNDQFIAILRRPNPDITLMIRRNRLKSKNSSHHVRNSSRHEASKSGLNDIEIKNMPEQAGLPTLPKEHTIIDFSKSIEEHRRKFDTEKPITITPFFAHILEASLSS